VSEQIPAYAAVYTLIEEWGDSLPSDVAHRNALVWRAVEAALLADRAAENEGALDAFMPLVAKEFWDLFPQTFVDAAHVDLCHPVCHQNLMECVENALRAYWAITDEPTEKDN
jgi:hypothetical protein